MEVEQTEGFFNSESLFLSFIAYNTNRKQVLACLATTDSSQYLALREIAINIVSGLIKLDHSTLSKLHRHRDVIRKLSSGKLTRKKLKESAKPIVECVRLALLHHEAGRQVHSSPSSGVGEDEEETERDIGQSSSSESPTSYRDEPTDPDGGGCEAIDAVISGSE